MFLGVIVPFSAPQKKGFTEISNLVSRPRPPPRCRQNQNRR
ncbi:hypothetical protein HMPREF0262_00802 [Clostridium sp. ATCC 29733]|nr:hypothetical protein HMPREF0262_00802 [Clostridium sp. ATCC 29733]